MLLRLADDRPAPEGRERRWESTVHHGGRAFVATATMASIFKAHADDVIERGETELVPLLHRGGVDLLLITPETNFAVVNIELGLTETRPIPIVRPAS
ncbi:MAG: hypothetical protein V4479_04650 [Actinomycetota bacterium]